MVNRQGHSELEAIRQQANGCQLCSLARGRANVVFGEGNSEAKVMFVGEAPGRLEDEQGLPFVGRSGVLLRGLLADAGVVAEDVFITSVVKCRPPNNRNPKRDEIVACSGWLDAQIQTIRPVMICTLGNFAQRLIRSNQAGISAVHGVPEARDVLGDSVVVYPLFHPAAALRSTKTLQMLRDDINRIPALLREAELLR